MKEEPLIGPKEDASPGGEDARLITALASVHPSGKDATKVGPHLYFVEYSYTPAGGAKQETIALVYDNGQKTHVFGGR